MASGGFAGSVLYVDLTSGRIWREPLSQGDAEGFIGGSGINTRLAYDLISPGTDPLGPDNALIYGAGPMVATMVPGAARTVITALSPQTGYLGSSAAGHFGHMLKFAGYDHVVIMGQAQRPVYLRIFDDHVTLVDASHLWGKDIYETCDFFWQQDPEVWVNCIGPAGENLVSHAVIITNKYSTYGSTGLGAVMGSKRLKAVVAKGSQQVPVADPPAFMRSVDRVYRELVASPYASQWRELGTLIQFQDYAPGATEKMERRGFDMPGWTRTYKEKLWKGSVTCPSCPIGCKARLETDWGKYSGMTVSASCPAGTVTLPFAQTLGLPADRPEEILKCSELCNRLGISTVAISSIIDAFIQMYQDGSIDRGDTGGLEFRRGEPALIHRLLGMIAHREGFGDLLAMRFGDALSTLGRETRFAAFRQEPWEKGKPVSWEQMYETTSAAYRRGYNAFTFGALVDPRRAGPPNAYSNITMMPGRSEESLRRYVERIGVPPGDVARVVLGGTDGYDVPLLTRSAELYNVVLYSFGSCQRPFISRVLPIEVCAQLFTAATGIRVTAEDLLFKAERIVTLQRLFNLRQGLTKADDMYPEGYLNKAEQEEFVPMLEKYYEAHGWDTGTGVPGPERLAQLGLEERGQGVFYRP